MPETDTAASMGEVLTKALGDGASSVTSYAKEGLVVMLPYALGIMGLYMGIRLSINFFRSVAN